MSRLAVVLEEEEGHLLEGDGLAVLAVSLDVSFSEAFPCVTKAPTYGSMMQLRIFVDRCSIEAFDVEGKMAMTNLVFPSEPYNNIKVKGGKVTIYSIKN